MQTLADGTHISHQSGFEKVCRGSEGRIRTERPFCQGILDTPEALVIEIRDPVSRFACVLDTQNQIAHRFALRLMPSTPAPAPKASASASELSLTTALPHPDALRPSMTREPLGSQTIEGVAVKGTRTTEIIPEGLEGNDRHIAVVRETWTSADLKINVLTQHNDPRIGESINRLTNIELSNPVLSPFEPPPGYKIVDETERVTLAFTRP